MSDYESQSGLLRKVERYSNETFEEQCLRLWLENGKTKETFEDTDELFEEFYEKYVFAKGDIWEILEVLDLGDEDMFCNITDNGDGTHSFYTRYYNGGTCMTEMIEDELKSM